MNRLRQILKDQRGVAFPLIIAIVLVLVMLMCCISEYFRLLIVAQGAVSYTHLTLPTIA